MSSWQFLSSRGSGPFLAAAAGSLICASALAAPSFISVGISGASDISADGQSVLGILTNAPTSTLVKVHMGSQATFFPGPSGGVQNSNPGGVTRGSDDLSVVSKLWYDVGNVVGVNCFLGNTVANQAEPCTVRYAPHRYAGGTWTNLGSFPRYQQFGVYNDFPLGLNVWVGGTRCDFNTFSANDISGDGNVVVGQGYLATNAPRSNGNAPSGICGAEYRAGVWSVSSGMFNTLPTQAGTLNSYAYKTNLDGSVIVGRDNNRLCVWRNTVQTLLDPSGFSTNPVMTRDGNTIASQMSAATALANGFPGAVTMAKWNWNGSAWVPVNIGLPAAWVDSNSVSHPCVGVLISDISDDGNTIVGTALHDTAGFGGIQRLFIWRPSINAGVPTDLINYVRSELPPGDTSLDGVVFASAQGTTYIHSCSADGNAILTNFQDQRFPGTGLTFEQGVIRLDTVGCEPPRSFQDPQNQTVGNLSNGGIVLNYGVSGTWPMTFQWQVEFPEGSNSWADLTDDHPNVVASSYDYHGTGTSKLIIGHLSGPHWGNYRCVATNSCGTVTSGTAIVQCGVPNVVAPVSRTVCAGNTVSLQAQAIGISTLTFQWYKNGSPLTEGLTPHGSYVQGVDTEVLTVILAAPEDAGSYSYSAANGCSSVLSANGTLTVVSGPAVTTQPANINARQGENKYFATAATGAGTSGGPFSYQWRKGGIPIADGPTGTGSSYSGTNSTFCYVNNISSMDAGLFDCVITGGGCANQTVTNPATLTYICPADLDGGSLNGTPDGGIDINDLLYFLVAFEGGTLSADLDDGSGTGTHDGGVDISDLLYFLIHFEAGC